MHAAVHRHSIPIALTTRQPAAWHPLPLRAGSLATACQQRRPSTCAAASTSPEAAMTVQHDKADSGAAPLPTTYKMLVAERCGESFSQVARAIEVSMPTPGPGQVLVRLHYAGINGGCETFRVRGEHWFAANQGKANFPLGAEGAGVIVAVGEGVDNLKVGNAVACNDAAAFAEYGIARAIMCTPLGPGGATPEAVALTLSAVTASCTLDVTADIKAGEMVLVTAAAGGTGHFAVQLAKLAGCRVVAVCGSEEKVRRLQELGADCVINYKTQNLSEAIAAACPSGVDVVYEGVGGAVRQAILPHLAPNARLLQVGYISEYPHVERSDSNGSDSSSGNMDEVALADLFWKGMQVDGPEGRRIIGKIWPKVLVMYEQHKSIPCHHQDPAAILKCKCRVFELYEQGKLQAWTDLSHGYAGVEQIPGAIDYMLKGGHTGKVVVPLMRH